MNENIEPKKEEKPVMIKHELICAFCGTPIGSLEVKAENVVGRVLTDEDLGFADHRCTDCEKTHGRYKDMHDFFMQTDDDKHEEFLEHIAAADGDIKEFTKRMIVSRPVRIFTLPPSDYKDMQKHLRDAERDLGIQDLNPEEKVEAIRLAPSLEKNEIAAAKVEIIKRQKAKPNE